MDFSIEIILIGVLLLVFFSDFLFRGLKKSIKSDSIVKQTEHKKENPKRRVNAVVVIVIWVLLGLYAGYLLDIVFNSSLLHNYVFNGTIKSINLNSIYSLLLGFLIAIPIVFIWARNFQYFKKRKKNTVLFLIMTLVIKVLIHYLFYPKLTSHLIRVDEYTGRRRRGRESVSIYSEEYRELIGEHIKVIFEEEIWLFIPSIILLVILVWFFNDKIKAR
jgi:hypothetical protein